MTIYDLRKIIIVQEVKHGMASVDINYTMCNSPKNVSGEFNSLSAELIAIGSIESEDELLHGYKLSQWDALNIVIRHEYRNYLESTSDKTDIFNAIAAITNPKQNS